MGRREVKQLYSFVIRLLKTVGFSPSKVIIPLLCAALGAAIFLFGWHDGSSHTEKKWQITVNKMQSDQLKKDKETAENNEKALKAAYKQRDEGAEIAKNKINSINGKYDDLLANNERLQRKFNQLSTSAAVGDGEATSQARLLQSKLYGEATNRSAQLAKYADELRVRLEQCNKESE